MSVRRALRAASVLALAVVLPASALVASPAQATRNLPAAPVRAAHSHSHLHAVTDHIGAPGAQAISTIAARRGTLTYGTVHVAGPTTLAGNATVVDVLAVINYIDGSGPIHGSMTLSSDEAGTLGLTYNARATVQRDGSTVIRGVLTVMSGSGSYAGLTGTGVVRGLRAAGTPPGGQVHYTIDIDLHPGTPRLPRRTHVRHAALHHAAVMTAVLTADSFGTKVDSGPTSRAWGTSRRLGTSVLDGVDVTVDSLVEFNYSQGSGFYTGFLVFTAEDSSTVVTTYTGWTTAHLDGSSTVAANLVVIATSGRWAGQTGRGSVTGGRPSDISTPLTAHIRLALH